MVSPSDRPPALRATEGTILRWSLPSSLGGPGRNRTRCRGDQPRRATDEDRAKPAREARGGEPDRNRTGSGGGVGYLRITPVWSRSAYRPLGTTLIPSNPSQWVGAPGGRTSSSPA